MYTPALFVRITRTDSLTSLETTATRWGIPLYVYVVIGIAIGLVKLI